MFGFGAMIDKLKSNPKTIVLTEGTDPRILEAASRLLASNFLKPILLGNEEKILKAAEDAIEANDNNFDGLINAVPDDGEDDPDDDYSSELSVKRAREYDAARQKAVEDEEIAKEKKRNARARAQSYREIDR